MLLLLTGLLPGQRTWRAEARELGLNKEQTHALAIQGFCFGSSGWNLEAIYTGHKRILFTTDALLRVYRKLLAHGLRQRAFQQKKALGRCLHKLWTALLNKGTRAGLPEHLVAGALALLEDKLPAKVPPLLRKQLLPLLEQARKGTGRAFPPGWAPPDERFSRISFDHFRPPPLLAESPALRRLHGARRWLIEQPLRLDLPAERDAALRLREALLSLPKAEWKALRFDQELLGPPADWDLVHLCDIPLQSWKRKWKRRRRMLRRKGLRLPKEPYLRILSESRTPDGIFLRGNWARTLKKTRKSPSSPPPRPSARDLLAPLAAEELGREDGSLHQQFLSCLGFLLAPPDSRAPKPFGDQAWTRKKEEQTILAGWVQSQLGIPGEELRKSPFAGPFDGYIPKVYVWVEPYPHFFSAFARLAKRASRLFPISQEEMDAYMQSQLLDLLDRVLSETSSSPRPLPETQKEVLAQLARVLYAVEDKGEALQLAELETLRGDFLPPEPEKLRFWLKKLKKRFSGKLGKLERAFLLSLRAGSHKHLETAWTRLSQLALKLGTILETQLQKKTASSYLGNKTGSLEAEIASDLRTLMAYEASPLDLLNDPDSLSLTLLHDSSSGSDLYARVGPPKTLHVLLPVHGKLFLFTGYFLPYEELLSPTPPGK